MITVVDSVVLQEPEGAPLGGFTSFWGVAESGRIYVADISNQRVVVFGPDGRYLRDLGAPGDGPGEMRLPVAVISLPGTDSVIVVDANRQAMLMFTDSNGEFKGESRTPFRQIGPSVISGGGDFTFVSAIEEHPFTRWSASDGGFESFGESIDLPVPAWQRIAMASGLPAAVSIDTVLATWQPATGLWLFDQGGHNLGHLGVPARLRKGEGPARVADQRRLMEGEWPDSVVISAAIGMGLDASGQVYLASQDADRVRLPNGSVRDDNIRAYLTVIDRGWRNACVDGVIPVRTDVGAPVLSQGGKLLYLARTVTPDGSVSSVVYSLAVDTEGCRWLPLEQAGMEPTGGV